MAKMDLSEEQISKLKEKLEADASAKAIVVETRRRRSRNLAEPATLQERHSTASGPEPAAQTEATPEAAEDDPEHIRRVAAKLGAPLPTQAIKTDHSKVFIEIIRAGLSYHFMEVMGRTHRRRLTTIHSYEQAKASALEFADKGMRVIWK